MKWLTTTIGALLVVAGVLWSVGTVGPVKAGSDSVSVPRSLAITACEIVEMVWVVQRSHPAGIQPLPERKRIDEVLEGEEVIEKPYAHWKDYEWNIVDGKLDCRHDIVPLPVEQLIGTGGPLGGDLSRHLVCNRAAMSIAPEYAQDHPGWWPFAVGCPNPLYSDGGTPGDTSDDRIVGYKMPECPREVNGIAIKCKFSENEI